MSVGDTVTSPPPSLFPAVPAARGGGAVAIWTLFDSPVLTGFRPRNSNTTIFRAQSKEDKPLRELSEQVIDLAAFGTSEVPVPPESAETPPSGADAPGTSSELGGDPGLGLPDPSTWNAFSPAITTEPFPDGGTVQPYLPGPSVVQPFGGPVVGPAGVGGFSTFGANGGRPYRFGLEQRLDVHLIPDAKVSGGGAAGEYEELGVDYDLTLTRPFMPGWILEETAEFRSRTWDGPGAAGPPAIPTVGLSGSAFHLGSDFELSSPQAGPYSISLGISPSINTDFESPSSTAFQLDGRGIIWWSLPNPGWTFGLGAMFWDRVEDRVIPYAGWVYRDDFWEWRLMFPEAEVRLFIGNEPWWSKWVYFRAKYNVEAYEIGVTTPAGRARDEVEFEDWQLTLGLQMDAGCYRWFLEGGLILDRDINFGSNPNVSVDTSYITRIGWRY